MTAENRKLNDKTEELEQYQRSNNLEIKGVPEEGDAYDVVQRIWTILNESISDSEIDVCHHVPTFRTSEKEHYRPLRATVETRCVLAEKQEKQRLTTKDLDYGGSPSPTYIN